MHLKRIKKLWGWEEWIVNEKEYCAKWLIFKKGYQSSLHYHKKKKETFMVVDGELELFLKGKKYHLLPYIPITIKPNERHTATAITDECIVLEVSTHHSDKDVVRIFKSTKL